MQMSDILYCKIHVTCIMRNAMFFPSSLAKKKKKKRDLLRVFETLQKLSFLLTASAGTYRNLKLVELC